MPPYCWPVFPPRRDFGAGVKSAVRYVLGGTIRSCSDIAQRRGRQAGCRSTCRGEASASAGHTLSMPAPLIDFPADDPDRARRFWHGVLGVTLAPRPAAAGSGWQTDNDGLRLGVHERGPGPADTASLPYFTVADLAATLERVRELGGSIIHPGDRWAVCRDSEAARSRWPPRPQLVNSIATIAARAKSNSDRPRPGACVQAKAAAGNLAPTARPSAQSHGVH
jgi:predicted enzyme related to lactoylglutathione lyase